MEFPLAVPLCNGRNVIIFFRPRFPARLHRHVSPDRRRCHRTCFRFHRTLSKLDPSACLPDPRVERHTDDLPVTARTIYVERLYGKQETTDLYYKKERGVLTPPFLRQL